MEVVEIIKIVGEVGAIGISMFWIHTLRAEVKELKVMLNRKEDAHITDLRTHTTEIQSILQNTIGDNVTLLRVIEKALEDLKRENNMT